MRAVFSGCATGREATVGCEENDRSGEYEAAWRTGMARVASSDASAERIEGWALPLPFPPPFSMRPVGCSFIEFIHLPRMRSNSLILPILAAHVPPLLR